MTEHGIAVINEIGVGFLQSISFELIQSFVDWDVVLVGGEVVKAKMDSHCEINHSNLRNMGLGEPPNFFFLVGKEG